MKILIAISILVVILVAGCTANQITNDYGPSYIDTNTCPERAKFVIDQHTLSPIAWCYAQELAYGSQTAHLVEIAYGSAMDCLEGCIYDSDRSIVFENNTIHPINTHLFSRYDQRVSDFIWSEIKLPINNVSRVSTRDLVDYDGILSLRISFSKYLSGEVYITEDGEISGEIVPTGLTVDDGRQIAIDLLEKEGYEVYQNTAYGPVSDNYFIDKDCWNFAAILDSSKSPSKCFVMVCLDGSTAEMECY